MTIEPAIRYRVSAFYVSVRSIVSIRRAAADRTHGCCATFRVTVNVVAPAGTCMVPSAN